MDPIVATLCGAIVSLFGALCGVIGWIKGFVLTELAECKADRAALREEIAKERKRIDELLRFLPRQ